MWISGSYYQWDWWKWALRKLPVKVMAFKSRLILLLCPKSLRNSSQMRSFKALYKVEHWGIYLDRFVPWVNSFPSVCLSFLISKAISKVWSISKYSWFWNFQKFNHNSKPSGGGTKIKDLRWGLVDYKLNRTWPWHSVTYVRDLLPLLTSSARVCLKPLLSVSSFTHGHFTPLIFCTTTSDARIGLVHALDQDR